MSTPSPSLSPTDPLAFLQTITLHYKYLSTTRVSSYVDNYTSQTPGQVTVTFQVQSNQTRAYKSYTTTITPTSAQYTAGSDTLVGLAWVNVWTLYHDDIVSFVAEQAVMPISNQSFSVPVYN